MQDFTLTHFTDDPDLAAVLDAAGVDRIGVDLEQLGKAKRQEGANSWISQHKLSSLAVLRPRLARAKLLARINPWNTASPAEIEEVLGLGAEVVMLPFFKTLHDIESVLRAIDGRALLVPLVETVAGLDLLEGIRDLGLREIHFGLTDLRLEMGYPAFVPVFEDPRFEAAVARAGAIGLRYAIAGVARPGDERLPIDPEIVYRQMRRLRARGALVSRSFIRPREEWSKLAADIAALREAVAPQSADEPARNLQA